MKKGMLLALIVTSLLLVGCRTKNGTNEIEPKTIETVTNIELGQKQYIEQLKNITINNTGDYIIITSKVKFESPENNGSFGIIVPYTINVEGQNYDGKFTLGSNEKKSDDGNPKYDVTITNLTTNYETEILIVEK